MDSIIFSYRGTCGISLSHLYESARITCIERERARLQEVVESEVSYESLYASLQLPFDHAGMQAVQEVVERKKALAPTMLVVVGIGGSSLGAKAVLQSVQGRIPSYAKYSLRVYFAETVDSDRMHTIFSILEQELCAGHNIIINVVTKSGTTTETIANFHVILAALKKQRPDTYRELVVVTTDKNSPLWQYGKQEGFTLLEIPKLVGGRYSVFSAVGLFLCGMVGIDVAQLCGGAAHMVQHCINSNIEENPALMSALIHYSHYRKGVAISDLFLFSVDLEAVGHWYRQLLAESIGKEFDRDGQRVLVGITPTVSLGSIDLHSVAQLYLGGPRDKFTTFVTVEQSAYTVTVPEESPLFGGKSFATIMHALSEGTQSAYLKNERPFCSVTLPEKNAWYIGQFLQFKMIETMYLGFLLHVDPFDQPNVELYKREAHRLLSQ